MQAKYVVPGPGQYHTRGSLSKQGITMGQKTNRNSFMNHGDNTPGPGQYNLVSKADRPRTAGGKIGERYKSPMDARPSTAANVGPGRYESKSHLKQGISAK